MKHPIACLLISLMTMSAAVAASSGGHEALFRCRDAKGQTFFGDRMPEECQNLDTEVLSESGNVLRVIDGAATRAAKAQNKSAEDAAKKLRADAAMHDRMLVEAYLSVTEIEQLRDQRIALVESQIHLDEQNLKALQDREQRLLRQATRYLPYKTDGKALPENVIEDMVNVVNNRQVTQDRIAAKQTEEQELKTKFASDIKRFRELKGQ